MKMYDDDFYNRPSDFDLMVEEFKASLEKLHSIDAVFAAKALAEEYAT